MRVEIVREGGRECQTEENDTGRLFSCSFSVAGALAASAEFTRTTVRPALVKVYFCS